MGRRVGCFDWDGVTFDVVFMSVVRGRRFGC